MLAFIIYGWSRSTNVVGQGTFHCPVCQNKLACDVVQSQTWITFFFIPVIPLGRSHPQLACRGCRGEFNPPEEIVGRHPATNPLPWILGVGGMMVVGFFMLCIAVLLVGASGRVRKHQMAQQAEQERREIERLVHELDRDFDKKHGNWERPDVRPREVMPPIAAPAKPSVPADVKWTPEPPKEAEPPTPMPKVITSPKVMAVPNQPAEDETYWNVQVDAGPPLPQFKVSRTFGIPLKPGTAFFFPASPSSFVGVRRLQPKMTLELWDWSQGRKVSEIADFNHVQTELVLSPQGKYAALPVIDQLKFETIRTWTFRPIKKADLLRDIDGLGMSKSVGFLPNERLLALSHTGKELITWDLANRTHQPPISLPKQARLFSTSPGGRYAACMQDFGDRLWVADLMEGKLAADILVAKVGGARSLIHVLGLSFSPDGKLLLVLSDDRGSARLTAWDVASGQIAWDEVYTGNRLEQSYRGQPIEWIEGVGIMLLGQLVVSPVGELMGSTPKADLMVRNEPRRAVNSTSLLMVKGERLVVAPLIETRIGPSPPKQ